MNEVTIMSLKDMFEITEQYKNERYKKLKKFQKEMGKPHVLYETDDEDYPITYAMWGTDTGVWVTEVNKQGPSLDKCQFITLQHISFLCIALANNSPDILDILKKEIDERRCKKG